MFVEQLTQIKESESRAEALQKQARIQSKQVTEEAMTKASQIVEEAENRAKDTYSSLIEDGQKTADDQYESYLEKIRGECGQMMEIAKGNKNTVIEFIAERIVKANVNN